MKITYFMPVKFGRWIEEYAPERPGATGMYLCSVCGEPDVFLPEKIAEVKYCSYCGAYNVDDAVAPEGSLDLKDIAEKVLRGEYADEFT